MKHLSDRRNPFCGTRVLIGLLFLAGFGGAGLASSPASVSTIYVNKYFEVRENATEVRYVFAGQDRIARLSGVAPGAPRVQRLRVRVGWNLLATAVSLTNATAQLGLPGGNSGTTAALKWVTATRLFVPLTPEESLPAGTVLWLNSMASRSLGIHGLADSRTNFVFLGAGDFVPSLGPGASDFWKALPSSAAVWLWAPGRGWQLLRGGPVANGGPSACTPPSGEVGFVQTSVSFTAPRAAASLRFYHLDHLGSSAAVSDEVGNRSAEHAFYPFGAQRADASTSTPEPYLFSQVERDHETGWDSFPARRYHSSLGRFVQPDPLDEGWNLPGRKAALLQPQKLNPYAYVRNNPQRYIDPTGNEDEPAPTTETAQPAESAPAKPADLSLPPGYIPAQAAPPVITFQPDKPSTGSGLTVPPPKYDAWQQAESARLTLTGQSTQPRPGQSGDLLKAIGKLQLNGKPLQEQVIGLVTGPALRDWKNATTGEKAAIITAGVVMAGLAAPALQNKDAVSGLQAIVPKVTVPIPIGKGLDLNVSVSTSKPEGGVTLGGHF